MRKAIACWALCALFPGLSTAAIVVETGDFMDDFAGLAYSSSDPFSSSVAVLGTTITGIGKFDPALGTLTDIIIDIPMSTPISGIMIASMDATQIDESEEFEVSTDATAEFGIYYADTPTSLLATPLGAELFVALGCGGFSSDGGCGDGGGDMVDLFGVASIFGLVDPADFIGAGTVDTLSGNMLVPLFAFWSTDNADGEMTIDYDISTGGIPDEIIVTYEYTPIPVPGALWLLGSVLAGVAGVRCRATKS